MINSNVETTYDEYDDDDDKDDGDDEDDGDDDSDDLMMMMMMEEMSIKYLPKRIKMIKIGTPKAFAVSPFGATELIAKPKPRRR